MLNALISHQSDRLWTRRWSVALLSTALCTLPCVTQAQEEDLDQLLELLAEETELATRSRQNADYVPGIITVLHADEARLLGARTALEALAFVPGIDISRDQYGSPALRVRSVDFFFNSGNVKVLVDGLPISREAAFQNGSVLLTPIEQIERIELIRGPGSGVHGDFAYMGLVNLITRHQGNAASIGVGRGDRRSIVAHFAHRAETNEVSLSGNVSSWESDRYDTTDALDNDEQRRMLNLKLALRDLSFKLVALDRDWQGLRRINPRPGQPPPPSPFASNLQKERSYNTELRYNWLNQDDNRGALWLQRQHNEYERQNTLFEGPRTELGGDWSYRLGRHRLLLQAQWARLGIDSAVSRQGPAAGETIDSRDMRSLVLQDQVDLNDRFQITAGVRYDELQDIDSELTPRLAAVWQISDHHLLKAQYAEGFRSPTVNEQFVDGQSIGRREFEKIETREIGYVYRRPNTVFRATGFSNRISDLLFPPFNQFFEQNLGIRAQGLEFELTHQPWRWLKVQATWSTANTLDDRAAVRPPDQPLQGFGGPSVAQPESLGNLALLFNQGEAWSGGLHWQHVGRRADRGIAGFQDGYDVLNLGLSYRPPRAPRLRLDWGLRNALEDDVFYIETSPGAGLQLNRYQHREWSFGITWSFD
ncbi:TonB-dependent receptor plug domain-containing protein [Pseudomarimonas arenosa]|uniref:TonB-dependent receptor n=1 Tax=Pseudomarimonas arenosa TaxID=2774145 RepID=A0AAW3ZF81_9GAMM|nr:TonB-dependent receptor [Pseudomarimonas arenosa]MBD8524835.1 TonB-dependent receptor [Pseudomarimonas arenosa]